MAIQRNPGDTCLLCKKDESNFKGSHMIPASLLKRVIGKRNYEEGYTVQPASDKPIREFYGSANLKNTNPTIQPNEFIVEHVFCNSCEKRFGVVESEILPYLTQKFFDPNQAQNFPTQAEGSYELVQGLKIPPKLLSIFMFGVAWRMSILYWAQTEQQYFLTSQHHELMRQELDKVMDLDQATFHKKAEAFPEWPYLLVSCRRWQEHTENAIIPHPDYRDPYCFWISEFVFIFSFAAERMLPFPGPQELGAINDGSAINQSKAAPYFIDVPTKTWESANEAVRGIGVDEFRKLRFMPLSQRKGISPKEAHEMIHALAKKIASESGKGFALCYDEAFRQLMN